MSHSILLESSTVHNGDFNCPHAGNRVKDESIPPKSLIQYIPAVFPVGKGPRELCILISDAIRLPDIVSFHQHHFLPIGHQPVCHLASEIPRRKVGELPFGS